MSVERAEDHFGALLHSKHQLVGWMLVGLQGWNQLYFLGRALDVIASMSAEGNEHAMAGRASCSNVHVQNSGPCVLCFMIGPTGDTDLAVCVIVLELRMQAFCCPQ